MMQGKEHIRIPVVILAAALAAITITGVYAYLSDFEASADTDGSSSTFSFAAPLDCEIVDEGVSTNAEGEGAGASAESPVRSGDTVIYKPAVQNKAKYRDAEPTQDITTPAFIYASVTVPMAKKSSNTSEMLPVFVRTDGSDWTDGVTSTDGKGEWVPVKGVSKDGNASRDNNILSQETSADGTVTSITYLYAYVGNNDNNLQEVKADETTAPVFSNVKMNSVSMKSVRTDQTTESLNIVVQGYAIQSQYLGAYRGNGAYSYDASSVSEIWTLVSNGKEPVSNG